MCFQLPTLMKVLLINDSPLNNNLYIESRLEKLEAILAKESSDLVIAPEYFISDNQEALSNLQLKFVKAKLADLSWAYHTILIPGTSITMKPNTPHTYKNVSTIYEGGDPVSGTIKNWVCGSDQTFVDANITGRDLDRIEYLGTRSKQIGNSSAIVEICNDHVMAKELGLPVPSKDLQIILGCSTQSLVDQPGKFWANEGGYVLEANQERVGHAFARYDGEKLEFLPLELSEGYAVAQIPN